MQWHFGNTSSGVLRYVQIELSDATSPGIFTDTEHSRIAKNRCTDVRRVAKNIRCLCTAFLFFSVGNSAREFRPDKRQRELKYRRTSRDPTVPMPNKICRREDSRRARLHVGHELSSNIMDRIFLID